MSHGTRRSRRRNELCSLAGCTAAVLWLFWEMVSSQSEKWLHSKTASSRSTGKSFHLSSSIFVSLPEGGFRCLRPARMCVCVCESWCLNVCPRRRCLYRFPYLLKWNTICIYESGKVFSRGRVTICMQTMFKLYLMALKCVASVS